MDWPGIETGLHQKRREHLNLLEGSYERRIQASNSSSNQVAVI
jgi:hypothetical protein